MTPKSGTPAPTRTVQQRVVEQLELARASMVRDQRNEAARHAGLALQLDPTNRIGMFYAADSLQLDCYSIAETRDRAAVCGQAIDAYKRLSRSDSSYLSSIGNIYDRVGDLEASERWNNEVANNGALPREVRIRALSSLMSTRATCTENALRSVLTIDPPENEQEGPAFDASANLEKLQAGIACGEQGLEYADAVLALGGGESWWTKRMLLDNLATISERMKRPESANDFRVRANVARERLTQEETEAAERRKFLSALPDPSFDPALLLNAYVISMPEPVLTVVARAVHASGTVTIQVEIDENGFVTKTDPILGPILLRAAGARLVRWARIDTTKTKLRVGVLLVEFKPES